MWIYVSWMFILAFCCKTQAVKRYYATESCGHVHGPDHLTVIEFDKDVDYIKNKPSTEQNLLPPYALSYIAAAGAPNNDFLVFLSPVQPPHPFPASSCYLTQVNDYQPIVERQIVGKNGCRRRRNTLWHCVIVIRGMPSAFTKKSIGIEWRSFHIRDPDINTVEQSVESCGKAYVTIYKGSDTSAPVHWTFCGKDTTRTFFEWEGDYVTLEFHADFRRNESYTTPAPPTTVKTCVTEEEAENAGVTSLPLCTTPKRKAKVTEPPDLYPYPEVYFRVDVTSFDYTCNESIPDEILKCNDSQRCLDQSLVCDFYFSQNCKSPGFQTDKSDQTRDAPSFCFRKETTTTLPTTTHAPPPPPFPWAAVAGAVGGVLGFLALCWCCWRPGWIPWRLSRVRNTPCFRTQHCICFRGPTRCCHCCAVEEEDEADYPKRCCQSCAVEEEDESDFPRRLGHGGVYNDGFNTGPNILYGQKLDQRVGRPFKGDSRRSSGMSYPGNRKPSVNFVDGKYQASNGSNVRPQNGFVPYNNGYGQDPNNFATDWLKFISGDGAHLREQR